MPPTTTQESTPEGEPPLTRTDWAWRRQIRANRHAYAVYRVAVALVGLVITLGGLALIPLPGPGWLIVIGGLLVWASEFVWARRLLDFVTHRLRAWNAWIQPKSRLVKGLVGLATLALVAGFFWSYFQLFGVPGLMPDRVEQFLHDLAGL